MELAILIIVVINLVVSLYHRGEILRGVQYTSDRIACIESKLDELLDALGKDGEDAQS